MTWLHVYYVHINIHCVDLCNRLLCKTKSKQTQIMTRKYTSGRCEGKLWRVCMSTFHVHCSSCFLYIFMLYEKWSRTQVTHRRCCSSAASERPQMSVSSMWAVRVMQDFSASSWMAGFSSAMAFKYIYIFSELKWTCIWF